MRKLLLLVMLSTGVMADSTIVYIGGDVEIPVRANASSSEDNIITSIALNEPVTLLQTVDGWSNIKYDGWQGWIDSRYLNKTKSNAAKVHELTKQVDSLIKTIDLVQNNNLNLANQLMGQSKKYNKYFGNYDFQESLLDRQQVELGRLQFKVDSLTSKNTTLLEQITAIKNSEAFYAVIANAIVLFLGVLIGFFGASSDKLCKYLETFRKSF